MVAIELVYFNAGGGHRAAALALESVLAQQQPHWQVRCVNLVELVDPESRFRRSTGMAPEDLYNKPLARGWTLGMAQQLRLLQALIALGHDALVARLRQHWSASRPTLVVSLIPNFNRALADSVEQVLPGVPFVTVMTDLADYPPRFWMEPGAAQHLVCGSERAVQQALAQGIDGERIHASSGMILRPDFYAPLALDNAAERERLGLDPRQPTAVVMFGGQRSTAMALIERELDELQLVLMCGHHRQLARQLRARRSTAARAVVEFTTDVRRHLLLGDFFIGKPGPGSLSEAVHAGLPVLTQRNAWTLPQERYNTDWVLEQGLGRVLGSWREVRGAAGQLLARLDEFKARVRHIDNRAVFELPSILQQILHSGPAGRCARAEWPSTRPMPYGVAAPQVGLAAPITLPG